MMGTDAANPFPDAAATWDRRFGNPGYYFGTAPNVWLCEHVNCWVKGQRVLCVADGEGRNSVWLASHGLQVDAFDVSPVGVGKARTLATRMGVQVNYQVNSCDDFKWPASTFDGVAAIFVQFADPEMRERMFRHIVECLRPGGTLILQGYTPRQLEYKTGGPPQVSHLYTEALIRSLLASLDIIELREYEADVAEGDGHHGRSALMGVVARRT